MTPKWYYTIIIYIKENQATSNFSIIPKDGSDIHRFSNRKCVSAMSNVEICEYQSHP